MLICVSPEDSEGMRDALCIRVRRCGVSLSETVGDTLDSDVAAL